MQTPKPNANESARDAHQAGDEDASEDSWDSEAEVSGIGPMEGNTDSEGEPQEHECDPEDNMSSREELMRMAKEFQDAGFRVARSRKNQRRARQFASTDFNMQCCPSEFGSFGGCACHGSEAIREVKGPNPLPGVAVSVANPGSKAASGPGNACYHNCEVDADVVHAENEGKNLILMAPKLTKVCNAQSEGGKRNERTEVHISKSKSKNGQKERQRAKEKRQMPFYLSTHNFPPPGGSSISMPSWTIDERKHEKTSYAQKVKSRYEVHQFEDNGIRSLLKSCVTNGLSELNYAKGCISSTAGSNVKREQDGWVQIELTADSGACDSVMPRDGPCEDMQIFPSVQSEAGFSYEVANGEELPCFGERRLLVWTEGAEQPRAMAIQVADVHKPLLSLSRCADAGYESRFGRTRGCLYDVTNGDCIPLERRGILYFLKAWVKSAQPSKSPPFGGQR